MYGPPKTWRSLSPTLAKSVSLTPTLPSNGRRTDSAPSLSPATLIGPVTALGRKDQRTGDRRGGEGRCSCKQRAPVNGSEIQTKGTRCSFGGEGLMPNVAQEFVKEGLIKESGPKSGKKLFFFAPAWAPSTGQTFWYTSRSLILRSRKVPKSLARAGGPRGCRKN